ncbi:hypothetical protein O988_07170 [Pseudogymnoascus sp. VKM F-3808]|nr:hypothetical protein O988_07170 [Pseudogymnoascus sp. VKM F-3808]
MSEVLQRISAGDGFRHRAETEGFEMLIDWRGWGRERAGDLERENANTICHKVRHGPVSSPRTHRSRRYTKAEGFLRALSTSDHQGDVGALMDPPVPVGIARLLGLRAVGTFKRRRSAVKHSNTRFVHPNRNRSGKQWQKERNTMEPK